MNKYKLVVELIDTNVYTLLTILECVTDLIVEHTGIGCKQSRHGSTLEIFFRCAESLNHFDGVTLKKLLDTFQGVSLYQAIPDPHHCAPDSWRKLND